MAITGADDDALTLAQRLASMAPGAELAVVLAGIDPALVDDDADLVGIIAGGDRQIANATANQLAAIAEFARHPWMVAADSDVARDQRGAPGVVTREFADDEIAARLRISPLSASYRLGFAVALESPLVATSAALATGSIDVAKARTIADGCRHLDQATAVQIETAVLSRAPQLTNGRLKAALRKALITADPVAAQQRCRSAPNERGVWVTPLDDGVAELRAVLAAPDALTIYNVLTATARAAKAAGDDTRVMAQLRADHLLAPFQAALATGELAGLTPTKLATHRGRRAELNVTVPASVIIGCRTLQANWWATGRSRPTCAVNSQVTRPCVGWSPTPVDGTFLAADTDTYRPNAVLTRHVEFRDQSCVFLGCPRPATRCHIDRSERFPDGRTCDDNLGPLCEHHHVFKHALDDAFAKLKQPALQQPAAGTFVWTMPTGHTYTRTRPAIGPPIKNEVLASDDPMPDLPMPVDEADPPPF
jgi:Domain of unknown function (DUF222)